MSIIGSIPSTAFNTMSVNPLEAAQKAKLISPMPDGVRLAQPTESFGTMLEGLVSNVSDKQAQAKAVTQQVLLGENDQLHQSVIAMQEASVAFSLMVEVRNKLVESYQELMRMQV